MCQLKPFQDSGDLAMVPQVLITFGLVFRNAAWTCSSSKGAVGTEPSPKLGSLSGATAQTVLLHHQETDAGIEAVSFHAQVKLLLLTCKAKTLMAIMWKGLQ